MNESRSLEGFESRLVRGVVGGVFAGLVFLLANMAYAKGQGMRGARAVTLGALAFGIALYLVNFQVLGRLFFEWFQEGPNQLFELFIHAVYGLLLVPFFASALSSRETVAERRAARPAGAARSAA